jgi:hypothetical protein
VSNFQELSDLVDAMADMAAMNRATYNSHIEQGFTEDQAMTLTIASMQAILKSAAKPDG